jgi:hypothetical protein
MSLRRQLSDLLSDILPSNPAEAIKGTELIRLVRMQLAGDYSDASLRYHFSIMSCDPASPIAKVEKGQGYYRRTASVPALSEARELLSLSQGRLDEFGGDSAAVNLSLERLKKFRAIVRRFSEVNGRFPFEFRDVFAIEAPLSNLWKFPEIAIVDWQTGEDSEMEMSLDSRMLALKQRLGLPPFRLTSARLRIQPSLGNFREEFFQALSTSLWTQGGELIYAVPIDDEALADGLRALNATFGIGVSSFGIDLATLDDLPRAAQILNAHPKETEALMERIHFDRIAAPRYRQHMDWAALDTLRRDSPELDNLVNWLLECVERGRAEPYREPDTPS